MSGVVTSMDTIAVSSPTRVSVQSASGLRFTVEITRGVINVGASMRDGLHGQVAGLYGFFSGHPDDDFAFAGGQQALPLDPRPTLEDTYTYGAATGDGTTVYLLDTGVARPPFAHLGTDHETSCVPNAVSGRASLTTTVKRALQMLRSRNRTRARCADGE